MNRYQKALNKIVKSSCPNCIDENGCSSCDIEKVCNATAKSWVDTLQKLIDKETPKKPKIEQQNDYIVYNYLYQPDVETTPIGGFSIPESEYIQNLAYKPITQQNTTISDKDLFIIIKALLWYLCSTQMPSDEEIKKFIKVHKEK